MLVKNGTVVFLLYFRQFNYRTMFGKLHFVGVVQDLFDFRQFQGNLRFHFNFLSIAQSIGAYVVFQFA